MASKPDPLDALTRFTQALDRIDPFEDVHWQKNDFSKMISSQKIWPRYHQMIELWRDLVRDMLRESIEEVLNFPNLPPTEAIRLGGLIERCLLPTSPESVIPIFSSIDSILGEVIGTAQNMANIIHGSSKEFGEYQYHKEPKLTSFRVRTPEALGELLRMYYGIYCIVSDTNPGFFNSLGDTCPMLIKEDAEDDERKKVFQNVYGYFEISARKLSFKEAFKRKKPGDLIHYFFRCVCQFEAFATIHPNSCKNLQRFLRELAPRLHTAIRQSVQSFFKL